MLILLNHQANILSRLDMDHEDIVLSVYDHHDDESKYINKIN